MNSILVVRRDIAPFSEKDRRLPDGLLLGATKSKAFTLRLLLCCCSSGLAGHHGTRTPQHALCLMCSLVSSSNFTFDSREGIEKGRGQ